MLLEGRSSLVAVAVAGMLAGSLAACGKNEAPASLEGLPAAGAAAASTDQGAEGAQAVAPKAHECKGQNDCKGQGGCGSGDMGCSGKNTCKGKGGCRSSM